MTPRRRSQIVVLSLVGLPLGALALGSMMPAGQEMRRNLYRDRAGCERDYSREQCEQNTSSSTTGRAGSGAMWAGPLYNANRNLAEARSDPGPGRTGQAAAFETSTRGGFGAIGRAFGATG